MEEVLCVNKFFFLDEQAMDGKRHFLLKLGLIDVAAERNGEGGSRRRKTSFFGKFVTGIFFFVVSSKA